MIKIFKSLKAINFFNGIKLYKDNNNYEAN